MARVRFGLFRSRIVRRLVRWALLLIPLILVSGELAARFYLGLGDPPLAIADPTIEYLFKPGVYHRFGNTITYNAYSMRSRAISPAKRDPSEFRVLMLGDSVINGGAQTDDSRLASSILEKRIAEESKRPTFVGNISAGSWGPPNELAYLQKFGLFDADVMVIVLSSHDYADAPDFKPVVDVSPSFPSHRPISALGEAVFRYLIPRLTHSYGGPDPSTVTPKTLAPADVKWCLDSEREMIRMAREHHMGIIVVQYPEAEECVPGAKETVGHAAIAQAARDEHVEPMQFDAVFRDAIAHGRHPFRDAIHPNDDGQRLIADALYPVIIERLRTHPGDARAPTTRQ